MATTEQRLSHLEGAYDHLATKADIAELRGATKADITELHGATKADIAELRGATKADIAELRGELRGMRWGISIVGFVLAALTVVLKFL